jgi:hypothetical protein
MLAVVEQRDRVAERRAQSAVLGVQPIEYLIR